VQVLDLFQKVEDERDLFMKIQGTNLDFSPKKLVKISLPQKSVRAAAPTLTRALCCQLVRNSTDKTCFGAPPCVICFLQKFQ